MNVSAVKLMCWLTSASLTVGLSAYAYDFFSKLEANKTPYDIDHMRSVLEERVDFKPPVTDVMDYDFVKRTFFGMNWTGYKAPPRVVVDPTEAQQAGPRYTPVEDLLSIQMIQVDTGQPEASVIFVAYLVPAMGVEDGSLKEGDALPRPHQNVIVESIRVDGVEFRFDGVDRPNETITPGVLGDEQLIVLVGDDGVVQYPSRPEISIAPSQSLFKPEQTTLVGTNRYQIGTEDAQQIGQNYAQILTNDLKYRTYHDPKTGRRAGIQIQDVRRGSVAERHGVRSGDVLISINGHSVTSEQEAIKFVKNNQEKYTTWDVVIENMGKRRTMTYQSPSN